MGDIYWWDDTCCWVPLVLKALLVHHCNERKKWEKETGEAEIHDVATDKMCLTGKHNEALSRTTWSECASDRKGDVQPHMLLLSTSYFHNHESGPHTQHPLLSDSPSQSLSHHVVYTIQGGKSFLRLQWVKPLGRAGCLQTECWAPERGRCFFLVYYIILISSNSMSSFVALLRSTIKSCCNPDDDDRIICFSHFGHEWTSPVTAALGEDTSYVTNWEQ